MRIAVTTLTRDRLQYTRHCFERLWELAGCAFDHFVFDNGSEDGTRDWLRENEARFAFVCCFPENLGISKAVNYLHERILAADPPYDLIMHFDNDCEPVTPYFLDRMAAVIQANPKMILSPWVLGTSNRPSTARPVEVKTARGTIESAYLVNHCGGLCRLQSRSAYEGVEFPEKGMPIAAGQDGWFSALSRGKGYQFAYMKDVAAWHYLGTKGQEADPAMKSYFKRKYREEQQMPDAE